MDSTGALNLEDIPGSLLVVGGGYIGLELGSVYAALGTRVTVVEMLPGLLPGADRDLVLPLHKRLEKMFETILLNTTVASLKEDGAGIRATFEGASVQEKDREKLFDRVLVSVGRKPNSEIPGLETTQVHVNSRGFIEVNKQLQTADPSIYAIGDVVGEPMLAHKASHEGRVAAEAIAGHKVAFEPNAIPAVVFTDPEVAWCGLTETQAEKEKREIKVAKFPWGASGRAITLDRPEGMTKLLVDPQTERVLGVGIVGAGAGELIAEGVLAIEMAALASDVAMTIHPHPTLSETVMESAEVFFGTSTDVYRPKRGVYLGIWGRKHLHVQFLKSTRQVRFAFLAALVLRSVFRSPRQSPLASYPAGSTNPQPCDAALLQNSGRPARARHAIWNGLRILTGGASGQLQHRSAISADESLAAPDRRRDAWRMNLKVVMDRAYSGSLKNLSTQPEGAPQEGVPPGRQKLGTMSSGDVEADFELVRVSDPSAGKIWLISSDTLAKVPELYDQVRGAAGRDAFARNGL